MISDIAAWMLTLFVLNPLQAEVREHADRMNASAEIVQQSQSCVETQAPRLIERASQEPGWAVATAIGVTVGWTSPATLLDVRDPNCAAVARLIQSGDGEA